MISTMERNYYTHFLNLSSTPKYSQPPGNVANVCEQVTACQQHTLSWPSASPHHHKMISALYSSFQDILSTDIMIHQ